MVYRFGEYVLDLHCQELRRADVAIPLERRVYQVLVYLVQHRDRPVTQEEWLEQLGSTMSAPGGGFVNVTRRIPQMVYTAFGMRSRNSRRIRRR